MRLPVDTRTGFVAFGLTAALAGCSLIPGGGDRLAQAPVAPALASSGPAADYPMVLGDPFTVAGELYTPADTLNYDAVGYAGVDDGAGVTVAHRTLPLPSYVEVTSLATGKTILARVERRGPMTGTQLVALSPAAATQLGGGAGTPIRVRRVNPVETARAELRAGRPAPEPIETPKALVEVLRRKLPASGMASLRPSTPARPAIASAAAAPAGPVAARNELPPITAAAALAPKPAAPITAAPAASIAPAPAAAAAPRASTAYPLPALGAQQVARVARPTGVVPHTFTLPRPTAAVAPAAPPALRAAPAAATPAPRIAPVPGGEGFVVQAGTFSSHDNAKRAAKAIDGYVAPAGKLFRVRAGPYTSRGQADAALAKVRAAGYTDARVYTAG